MRDPIIEYGHSGGFPSGVAVIGGYRYRGTRLETLRGEYIFADWQAGGKLFVASEPETDGLWPVSELPVSPQSPGDFGQFVLSFGRDHRGELYVLTTDTGSVEGTTGAVHRLGPGQSEIRTTSGPPTNRSPFPTPSGTQARRTIQATNPSPATTTRQEAGIRGAENRTTVDGGDNRPNRNGHLDWAVPVATIGGLAGLSLFGFYRFLNNG